MLILDEADEMLNKGFKEQIYDVYRYLPPAIQVRSSSPGVHNTGHACPTWLAIGLQIARKWLGTIRVYVVWI